MLAVLDLVGGDPRRAIVEAPEEDEPESPKPGVVSGLDKSITSHSQPIKLSGPPEQQGFVGTATSSVHFRFWACVALALCLLSLDAVKLCTLLVIMGFVFWFLVRQFTI